MAINISILRIPHEMYGKSFHWFKPLPIYLIGRPQPSADGVDGIAVYSIVRTLEDQLLVVHELASVDAFMDYVHGPNLIIELIEHLCERFD